MTIPAYQVDTVLLRAEKLRNSKNGNSQWRLHTQDGIYITASDINQSHELTTRSSGALTLEISNNKVVGWDWRTLQ